MSRRLRPLTTQDLSQLPSGCRECAFWESGGVRERRCGSVRDEDFQRAWLRHVTDEWGDCGRVAYEDDELLGFIKYAPSRYFPQASTFSSAPEELDVPLIACMHVSADARHHGLGTVLLRACLRDLAGRGERRVETIAFAEEDPAVHDAPMLGVPFLLRNGFTVTKPDTRFPLLRLDLKSLVMWHDNLEAVLESLRFPLRVPRRAPASWMNGR